MPDIEPGPGEALVAADDIDTSNIHLEDEPPKPMNREIARGIMIDKEAINAEIAKALQKNLENPVFPILVVRIFDIGGALHDAGLNANMPPMHRLLIGSVVLVLVIGVTNPDVVEKIAAKWKKLAKKAPAPPHEPEERPNATT